MLPYKLHRRLGSEEIRAALQTRPRKHWRPRRWMLVVLIALMAAWLAVLLGGAIDYELNRVSTALGEW